MQSDMLPVNLSNRTYNDPNEININIITEEIIAKNIAIGDSLQLSIKPEDIINLEK